MIQGSGRDTAFEPHPGTLYHCLWLDDFSNFSWVLVHVFRLCLDIFLKIA
jgi:hypothetical protein